MLKGWLRTIIWRRVFMTPVGHNSFPSSFTKRKRLPGRVEVVNANGTSTTCSRCGHKCRMPLSVRVYRCGKCGLIIDRDHNSSLNVEGRKGRIVPSGRRRVAVVKEPRTYRSIVSDVAPQS